MLTAILLTLAAYSEPLAIRPKSDIVFSGTRAELDIEPTDGPFRAVPSDAFRYCELHLPAKTRLSSLSTESTLIEDKPFVTQASDSILMTIFNLRDSISRAPLRMICLRNASVARQREGVEDVRQALSFMFNIVDPNPAVASKTQE